MNPELLFQNATLFAPGKIIQGGGLLVQDGKIAALGEAGSLKPTRSVRIVDASDLILAPGYIDLQINGAFGLDFTETPAAMYEAAAGLPAFGVTAFLPTIITSPPEQVQAALKAWRHKPARGFQGAVPLGLHLEGPMINPRKKGAHNPASIRAPSLEVIAGWTAQGGVRLVTLAPELAGSELVTRELRQRGIVVSAGHSMASYEQGLQAFQSGTAGGTHLFNAMPPLDHRAPGLAVALLQQPTAYAGLIADGVHVHPAMIALAWQVKKPDHLVLVSDAMAALGMQPGVYHLAGFDVTVDGATARLPDGTLAGSLLTMDAAVRNLVAFTGCTLAQAAACVAANPARLLGLETKGWLAPGMDADLVLLSPEGNVLATLVMGRVVYSSISILEVGA